MLKLIPFPVFLLTVAGLCPFLLFTIAMWLEAWDYYISIPFWKDIPYGFALVIYGVVILTFLGGINWGIASILYSRGTHRHTLNRLLVWSNMVALAAWATCFLPTLQMQMGAIILGFVVQWFADMRLCKEMDEIPEWYALLRTIATILVLPVLIAAFVASGM